MPVIYIDVLFVINFIIDSLILICTAKIGGFRVNIYRICGSAIFGGLYSVLIFFPDLPDILLTLSKCAVSSLMIIIAVKINSKSDFLRGILCFYISNFILGGTLTAVMYFTEFGTKTNALLSNGSVYFDISLSRIVIFSVCITAALSYLAGEIKSRLRRSDSFCTVTIGFFGKTVTADGFIDTGNSLSYLGTTPVTVADFRLIEKLFDENISRFIKSGDISSVYETGDNCGAFTLVPYNAVGTQCGFLIGFKPDFFLVNGKETADSIIAVYNNIHGRTKILVNPDALV